MYHQIARNKRNSIIVVTLFLLVWLLAGFVIGEFAGGTSYAVAGALILGALGVLAALYSYYFGSSTVLSAVGAKEADPGQFQQLYNIVQTLSIGDGLPVPKVYIIDDPSPNAFATGRDHQHDAVTVTPGRPDQRPQEDCPEREADAAFQPRGRRHVHRQPDRAPRQLLQPPVRHPSAHRGADRCAGEDRERPADLEPEVALFEVRHRHRRRPRILTRDDQPTHPTEAGQVAHRVGDVGDLGTVDEHDQPGGDRVGERRADEHDGAQYRAGSLG